MVTDETLFAWLDGELDAEASARVASLIAADEGLAARVAQHRAMQARLKGAFGQLLDAPVPAALLRAAQAGDPPVVDLAEARRSRETRRWAPLPQWAAIAATLVVGIVTGTMVSPGTNAPVEVQDGKLYAAATLNRALDTQLASAPSGDVRIGLTFRDRSGAICRSFTQPAASGLACHDARGWQLRGLFAAPEGQAEAYRMAAGMDPNLAVLVDSTRASEPFGSDEERAAQERGWR